MRIRPKLSCILVSKHMRHFAKLICLCWLASLWADEPIVTLPTDRLIVSATDQKEKLLVTYRRTNGAEQEFCIVSLKSGVRPECYVALSLNDFLPGVKTSWREVFVSNAAVSNKDLYLTLCPSVNECSIFQAPFISKDKPLAGGKTKLKRYASGSALSCDMDKKNCFVLVNGDIVGATKIHQLNQNGNAEIKDAKDPLVFNGYLYFTSLSRSDLSSRGIFRSRIGNLTMLEQLTKGYDYQPNVTSNGYIVVLRKSSKDDEKNIELIFLEPETKKIVLKIPIHKKLTDDVQNIKVLPDRLAIVTTVSPDAEEHSLTATKGLQTGDTSSTLWVYDFPELCTTDQCKSFFRK